MRAQCTRSATIWASGRTRDPCFEIIGAYKQFNRLARLSSPFFLFVCHWIHVLFNEFREGIIACFRARPIRVAQLFKQFNFFGYFVARFLFAIL